MIPLADVRHDGDIAAIEAQTGSQDAAASRFEHRRIDRRIEQNVLRALRAAAIASLNPPLIDIDPLGASHADAAARAAEDVRDKPRGGRLAVDSRDGDDRDAPVSPGAKSVPTIASPTGRDLPTDGSKCIRRPGAAFTSTITPALRFQRAADIEGDDIHAGHVKADDAGRLDRPCRHVGMHQLGDIGRRAAGAQVRIAANQNASAGRRD